MTYEMHFTRRTRVLILAAGLFVLLLYLYLFVPFGAVVTTLQKAELFYILLAIGSLLLSITFYSLTWQCLLHLVSVKVSFLKALQFTWIANFVDVIVPGEAVPGDLSRIYLVSKVSSENAGKVVASVVGHRFLSGVVVFGGFLAGSVYFILKSRPEMFVQAVILIMLTVTLVSLSLMFYLSTRRHATEKLVNWLINLLVRFSHGRWHFDHLRKSAEKMLSAFHDGIATFGQRPKRLILPLIFAIVAWLFDLLIIVLIFFSLGSLGVTIPLSLIVVVYSIGIGLQTAPLGIPAEIGIYEIVMTSVYTLFGVPIAESMLATLFTRAITLLTKLLIGGVAVQWLGLKGFKVSLPPPPD